MFRIVLSGFALLFSLATSAQTSLPTDATIRKGTLANGLSYYIRHNNQTPGQADFYLANRVGSILETPEQRGLAHFLEHMAFNGTEHFPYGNGEAGSIRNWCESKGIKFGADLNASTSIDQTLFNIANAPVTKAGVVDTCMLIIRDWSCALLLKDNEIDQERGVIREEWRTRRSNFASTRMMEEAMPAMYKGSKYEDCLPIGYKEVIDTFHYATLRDYYEKWYRPDLQAVVVVGDIDVDDIEKRIEKLFSPIAAHENAPERIYYPVKDNDEMIVYTKADSEQPTLNLSLYMKRDTEPRATRASREAYVEGYKSRMAMFILRQRLQQLTKQSPVKVMSGTCRDNMFYISKEKDAFALTIGLLPNQPKEGIEAVIEVVEKARRYGFTEGELGHAKDQHTVSLEHDLDNKDNTRNGTYVSRILDSFLNAEHLMDIESKAELEASLSQSITLEEVNQAIKDIVVNKNQVCVVLGPTHYGTDEGGNKKAYTMPSADDFKKWIEEAQKKDYADDAKPEQVDFTFMKKLPKKGKILAKKLTSNGYTEYLLSNGIRVHARPSKLEPNRLTINMFRLGGKSLLNQKDAATMQMFSQVIKESGAADFDFLTLEKKRRGKALRVTPYINSEDEGVNGVCVASDFKTWLEICYLYITQPRKDASIFNAKMDRQRSMLQNRTASPNVTFNDSLRTAIYGNTEFAKPLTIERLDKVSHDRMYEIYRERFADLSGMNLIVTGDIREDDFEDLLVQYAAALPGKKPSKAEVNSFKQSQGGLLSPAISAGTIGESVMDIRKVNESHVFHLDRKTPSATTNLIYSAAIPYTAKNDLIADVLSQIMRAVYTEKVREEKGGTYGVSVKSQMWKYPSDGCSMTIDFRCAPESYEALMPIVEEQLKLMAENGPTDAQLQKVKEYELKNYDRAILTNGWWEYVRYHELHDGIDFGKDYVKLVNELTPADIRNFCKQLLASNQKIIVTMK